MPIQIQFSGLAGSDSLIYGNQYFNSYNEPYSVSAFKFYIHGIELFNSFTGIRSPFDQDAYHLIDIADPATNLIQGIASDNTYNGLSLIIGVDSILNVSGAQSGALDPLNGMFWTWNSGYIMAKLEGNTPLANTPNNAFQYHIGGFSGDNNVVKRVEIFFPNNEFFKPAFFNEATIVISADVHEWFSGQSEIRLSQDPVCMTPGSLAKLIAENYYEMFTISTVIDRP